MSDYMDRVEKLKPLNIAKDGYTVRLTRGTNDVLVTLYFRSNKVSDAKVPLRTVHGGLINFGETLDSIRRKALAMYTEHNASLSNPELLKAIEDRLNADETALNEQGMTVIVGGPDSNDTPDLHVVG